MASADCVFCGTGGGLCRGIFGVFRGELRIMSSYETMLSAFVAEADKEGGYDPRRSWDLPGLGGVPLLVT